MEADNFDLKNYTSAEVDYARQAAEHLVREKMTFDDYFADAGPEAEGIRRLVDFFLTTPSDDALRQFANGRNVGASKVSGVIKARIRGMGIGDVIRLDERRAGGEA